MQLERGATELERIIEPLLDLDIEPAVDTAIDKLRREVEHDEQRQHRESDEHADHARLELGARHVATVIPREARQVADQQRQEQNASRDVDGKDNILQAIEVVGLLHRLRQQEQSGQRRADASRRHEEIKRSL